MSLESPGEELGALIDLIRSVGEDLLALYRTGREQLRIEHKGPRDLVSAADRRAEDRIISYLSGCYPGDGVLAEERGGEVDPGGRVWIVDPLDGTTNFTHGHPFFCVSIALWESGVPRLGVIHAPAIRETYWAERGRGAFRNGERVSVSEPAPLAEALLATGFSYRREEVEEGALASFGSLLDRAREIRRGGSACLDLAHTAAGIFNGFWEYHLHAHDVAAGVLLVLEAGGLVSDCRAGGDFLFGGSIVAGEAGIHHDLLEVLREGPDHPGS